MWGNSCFTRLGEVKMAGKRRFGVGSGRCVFASWQVWCLSLGGGERKGALLFVILDLKCG